MAGSRKDVNYVADDGTTYAIQVDESNIELVMAASVPIATSPIRRPSNLKRLRSVILSDVTGLIKRTIPVLSQSRYNALNNSSSFTLPSFDPDSGTLVGVSAKNPEKFVRLPKSFDTGKDDGDAS